jgi:hypothetical protein
MTTVATGFHWREQQLTMEKSTFAGPTPESDVHAAPSGLMPFDSDFSSTRVATVTVSSGPKTPSKLQLTTNPYAPVV